MAKISLVVPMYNEAENVSPFYESVSRVLNDIGLPWEMICVNDGSRDNTLTYLIALHQRDPRVKVVDFSRNFGKEVALSAGIDYATGDAVVTIDADLQHPPDVIKELISKWYDGCDIVFAVRRTRKVEGLFKRITTRIFYRVLGWLANIPNHDKIGDFCLLDKRVLEVLRKLPEHNRFMKGLFAWVGFKQDFVVYDLNTRKRGATKWSYWRLWNFALEGITSFSTIPLRMWTYIGFAIALVSFLYAAFIIVHTLVLGIDVPGYASLIVSILFMGGIQLISLGIIGEYIGRIYNEVKERPLYIVREAYGFDTPKEMGVTALENR
ncbi:putative glycosyltransferase [bacterium HR37]|nr:putative glycosyltransferase [bacterium HR37]